MARPKRAVLQCDTIGLLADGLFGRVVDRELENLYRDIDERGNDGKPRELTIKIALHPAGNGVVDIDAKATTKIPAVVPPRTTAKLNRATGGLVFNPEVADSPDQTTYTDDADAAERGRG